MSANTSTAVMQQRNEARNSLDDYPTPPWALRALMEKVLRRYIDVHDLSHKLLSEPACNRGFLARVLLEYSPHVDARDVHDYGYAGMAGIRDFLFEPQDETPYGVFTNPPFVLAHQFIQRCLDLEVPVFSMFVRTSFLEGGERYYELYSKTPPTIVAQFAERVVLTKGRLLDPNVKVWDKKSEKWKLPSTATSYCWLTWVKDLPPQPMVWIPPCRRDLERQGDYEVA